MTDHVKTIGQVISEISFDLLTNNAVHDDLYLMQNTYKNKQRQLCWMDKLVESFSSDWTMFSCQNGVQLTGSHTDGLVGRKKIPQMDAVT